MPTRTEAETQLRGCQCGPGRYRVSSKSSAVYACHCTECRKQSSSAFGISFVVQRSDLTLLQGEPSFWSRPTASGHTLVCAFCARCGSRVWHQSSGSPETVNIKGGSLDEPVDLSAAIHIWTASKLAGVVIPPGAKTFPGEPD